MNSLTPTPRQTIRFWWNQHKHCLGKAVRRAPDLQPRCSSCEPSAATELKDWMTRPSVVKVAKPKRSSGRSFGSKANKASLAKAKRFPPLSDALKLPSKGQFLRLRKRPFGCCSSIASINDFECQGKSKIFSIKAHRAGDIQDYNEVQRHSIPGFSISAGLQKTSDPNTFFVMCGICTQSQLMVLLRPTSLITLLVENAWQVEKLHQECKPPRRKNQSWWFVSRNTKQQLKDWFVFPDSLCLGRSKWKAPVKGCCPLPELLRWRHWRPWRQMQPLPWFF